MLRPLWRVPRRSLLALCRTASPTRCSVASTRSTDRLRRSSSRWETEPADTGLSSPSPPRTRPRTRSRPPIASLSSLAPSSLARSSWRRTRACSDRTPWEAASPTCRPSSTCPTRDRLCALPAIRAAAWAPLLLLRPPLPPTSPPGGCTRPSPASPTTTTPPPESPSGTPLPTSSLPPVRLEATATRPIKALLRSNRRKQHERGCWT
mmetsp:Transcript_30974/g.65687  ORF Transcript_30974/g.65687 Transcript_30974/m.65687 type:complete len:207 (-) Transcript_30974:13-633(-)